MPLIHILATGGTIAGVANDPAQHTVYEAAVLNVKELLKAVPAIGNIAHIQGEQIVSVDSKDMTIAIWSQLKRRIDQLVDDETIDGIVITHGTDTLEETAFFLYLTAKLKIPIVLTAAMRPSNAPSPDGPLNLQNAITVAASPASKQQGVLIVMNNQIFTARDVTKTNTYSVDTFRSNDFGALGWIQDSKAYYQRSISDMHLNDIRDRITNDDFDGLPLVEIVLSYASPSPEAINALIKKGVKGIVIAGTGDGTIHQDLQTFASEAARQGLAIVRSFRVSYGHVTHNNCDDQARFITAGTLNAWKARILLMLILAIGINDYTLRQNIFNCFSHM